MEPEHEGDKTEVMPQVRRERRQAGQSCGNCISWTRAPNPVVEPDPLGTCECGPPTATAIPQQGAAPGLLDFAGVTKWPVSTRRSWFCQQWQFDSEAPRPAKGLPNWGRKRAN